jgi:L-fuculose-phosphate aldolase
MSYGGPTDEPRLDEAEARRRLCEVGRLLWERQFVEANAGNLSYRLDAARILATPTMISKGFMKPEDLVLLDPQGNQLAGARAKTSEILVHLQIFRHRPDVRCVIHTHAPHATAFAVTGTPLPKCVHPELEVFLGEVPIAPYRTPGTQAVADALLPYLRDFNVFLLASHGVVAAGGGITEALWRTEVVEAYCRLIVLTKALGEPTRLTQDQMSDLLAIKERLGLPDRRIEDAAAADCDAPVGPDEKSTPPPLSNQTENEIAARIARRAVDLMRER